MNVFRLRKWPVMGQKPSRSCAMYCRVSVAACTALPAPMIIRLTKIFIIDTLPGHDNTLLITGLSGHGFKFASVLGEIAADFCARQKKAILI